MRRLSIDTHAWLGVLERPGGALEVYTRDPHGRWSRSVTERGSIDPRLEAVFERLCASGEARGLTELQEVVEPGEGIPGRP